MEPRRAPEYMVEIAADRTSVKEVVKGILHTIFFHRVFTAQYPSTHEVLDVTLPYISEDDVESTIETRASSLMRQMDVASSQLSPQYTGSKGGRGQIVVQFLEKKRKKSGWFVTKADEETVWEVWIVDITVTSARSESETTRNRRRMERNLQEAAMKVLTIVNQDRSYIPPITTNDTNPFPYQILVNPKKGIF